MAKVKRSSKSTIVLEQEPSLLDQVLEATKERPPDPMRMFTKGSLMLLAIKVATAIGFKLGREPRKHENALYHEINSETPVPRELFDAIVEAEINETVLSKCCGYLYYME